MKAAMKKISLLVSLALLASCSSTHTVKQLQSEYDNHKYSRYVIDNLKEQAVAVVSGVKIVAENKRLDSVKRQIVSRKKHAGGKLQSAINQNGLYKPSSALQPQLARLNTQKKSENWLKTHSSLDAVLTMALRNNLDIKSAKEQAQASLEKYDQVAYLDDMLAQYAAFTKDIKLTGSTQKHKKYASAAFPFPGLLSLKSSIIDQTVNSSRLALKQTTQGVITNTRVVYYQLQFVKKEISITKENIRLLESLKEELESSYSANSSDLSGILKGDIDIANSRNKLQIAQDTKKANQARLNALLNLSPAYTLGKLDKLKAEQLDVGIEQLIKRGKANRVEIARLKTDIEKMKRIIQLSEKRFYPDFDAGFSRFQNGKFTTKPKIKKSNFFAKNDAYLSETRIKLKALQSKLRALQNKTADGIQQAVSNYQSQKRTYQLYRNQVLPKARTTLEVAKNLYETGETSYVKVIEAQKMILNYRLKSVMAVKGMNVAHAKVLRLTGILRQ